MRRRNATFLNQSGLRVDYSDVHGEALRFAVERAQTRLADRDPGTPPPRFLRADITQALPPGEYDGILLLDVLEHLPDDRAVLGAVRDRLRERQRAKVGGDFRPFVLFTVPAFQFLWSPWDDLEKHKRRFTLSGARDLVQGFGFETERVTYFFFPLFFAAGGVKALRLTLASLLGRAPPPALRGHGGDQESRGAERRDAPPAGPGAALAAHLRPARSGRRS